MNRFFDREEYRREIPRKAFARLDDIEPIFQTPENDLTFVLDAVDAEWDGFKLGEPFDLAGRDLAQRAGNFWQHRFEGRDSDEPDLYERIPIYRIELSVRPGDNLFKILPRDEESWITLRISEVEGGAPIDVYGGLFAPPTRAYLQEISGQAPSEALSALFDMDFWPDTSEEDLLKALRPPCELDALVCFDVGQGSASALVCQCGQPIYYFDTGRGAGRNAPTAPHVVDFCTCSSPTVILSHWDTDHWAGAAGHAGLQKQHWVVPRQTISTTHTVFANDILKAGGSIHVVGHGAAPLQWTNQSQSYDLQRATGSGRNGSGLVLVVTDHASGRSWVLTGDAGYDLIAQASPADIAAMVVPHHGANMGSNSAPYPRSSDSYARLFYSFGPGNGHGPNHPPVQHPVAPAVTAHQNRGWNHGAWSSNSGGLSIAGGDVIATALHQSTNLGGGVAGWAGPPVISGHLPNCANSMPITQR